MADARVEEAEDAVLAFAVTLSRAAASAFTVNYATEGGSALEDVDYKAASGTLRFEAGDSSKTIEVEVFDDDHDEDEETLTLTLSDATSGRLADAEATGTIKNHDPLPRGAAGAGSGGRRRYTWSSTWRSGSRRRASRASGASSRAGSCGVGWSGTSRSVF